MRTYVYVKVIGVQGMIFGGQRASFKQNDRVLKSCSLHSVPCSCEYLVEACQYQWPTASRQCLTSKDHEEGRPDNHASNMMQTHLKETNLPRYAIRPTTSSMADTANADNGESRDCQQTGWPSTDQDNPLTAVKSAPDKQFVGIQ